MRVMNRSIGKGLLGCVLCLLCAAAAQAMPAAREAEEKIQREILDPMFGQGAAAVMVELESSEAADQALSLVERYRQKQDRARRGLRPAVSAEPASRSASVTVVIDGATLGDKGEALRSRIAALSGVTEDRVVLRILRAGWNCI